MAVVQSQSHCPVTWKRRYTTRKRALGAMFTAGRHSHNRPARLRVYKCPHCRSYHLTSGPSHP